MASATVAISQTLTCQLLSVTWIPTGDYLVTFAMQDTNGISKRTRMWTIKADGSGLFDESGTLIQAVAGAVLTNFATVRTNIDSALVTAAAAGKITL